MCLFLSSPLLLLIILTVIPPTKIVKPFDTLLFFTFTPFQQSVDFNVTVSITILRSLPIPNAVDH